MRTPQFCRLMLLPLLLTTAASLAEPAGRLVYAHGDVGIRGGDGRPRPVEKGASVSPGDTIVTGSGRTQVSFADGGYIAVQPNTQFRIDEYNYAGREDGTERSFFALVKGGIRFISGAIGHRNKANYRIQTSAATIGIRGSAGRVEVCNGGSCGNLPDGTYVTGNQDILTITNGTGTQDIGVGQTFHAACPTCPPQQVRQAPGAYAAVNGNQGDENQAEDTGYMAGQQVDENGNPLAVADFKLDSIPPPVPVSGTGSYYVEDFPVTLTVGSNAPLNQTASFFYLAVDFASGNTIDGFIDADFEDVEGSVFYSYFSDATGGRFTTSDRSAGTYDLVGTVQSTDETIVNTTGTASYTFTGNGATGVDGRFRASDGVNTTVEGSFTAPAGSLPAQ